MAELRAPHLPNEVYLHIANHLAACSEDHELFGLRLISQIFTQGVDDHFLRVYYANRMCPATLEGLRILRYMFQDLTLASSIQKLTMDEYIGIGCVDMVAYVKSTTYEGKTATMSRTPKTAIARSLNVFSAKQEMSLTE
ncbi:hypothetical protein D6D18_09757 [Aureobasidium pullulans]|nr:hypothetical protein D6D18_09757 [Aureobasidium pullulans]